MFALVTPWPLKLIVDGVLQVGDGSDKLFWGELIQVWLGWLTPTGQIVLLCLTMAFVSLCSGFLAYLGGKLSINSGLRAVVRLRASLYEALQYLPLRYHDAVPSSDLTYRVTYDTQAIQTIYSGVFLPLFASSLTLAGSLVVMLRLNTPLTLVSCLVVPPVFWCLGHYTRTIGKYSNERSETESSLQSVAQEVLSSVRHVKANVREQSEVRRFLGAAEKSLHSSYLLNKTQMKSSFAVSLVMSVGTASLYLVGSLQILAQSLTLGSLLVFATYLSQLYRPIESLSGIVSILAGAQAGLGRSFQILEAETEENAEDSRKSPLRLGNGAIHFDNVSFGYSENSSVLKSFSLDIRPSEFVAIVGPTGQGKSTLLSLLAGFYDPTSGRILVDGQDIAFCSKSSLRSEISLVMQDSILFSGTIAENIGYGRPSATLQQIEESARRAEAHDFIDQLPYGYNTMIGEGGVRLSGGQRQRISIARAFLRNVPILILDEPTSALDNLTESRIRASIARLAAGRTTLLVTHRLALAECADRVVVMDRGSVAEIGSPAQLLSANGYYAALKKASSVMSMTEGESDGYMPDSFTV
ncbi:ABC transporter ATP-binding protein [Cyanobium sp. AMD-g]|nr:ABC transporter ATP-binding protein [Cyanobium sp. AMD-g]